MSNRVRILLLALIATAVAIVPVVSAAAETRSREEQPHAGLPDHRVPGSGIVPDGALQSRLGPSTDPFGFGSSLVGSAPVGNGPSLLAVNSATHTIYVANGENNNGPAAGGDTVSVIDARRCNAHDVSDCKGPWPTITVGDGTPADLPSGIAIEQQTDTVYVTNVGDNTVSVINGATCNAENTEGCGNTPTEVPVGLGPLAIYADPANHTLYVADLGDGAGSSTSVSMIDSATCNATDLAGCPSTPPPTVDVGAVPLEVDVNQSTHTVYVTTLGALASQNGWAAFDASTCNATVQTGCHTVGHLLGDVTGPNDGEVDVANDTLYTANYDITISVFDLRRCQAGDLSGCATDTPGTITPWPNTAARETDLYVAVDPSLHSVYVSYAKSDALVVVNTSVCNGAHLAACATLDPPSAHTGADPEGVVLDPATQTLYAVNEVDNDVSVIDATRCDAETSRGCRHPAPSVALPGPGPIATDSAVHTAYVLNGNNAVSMIDTRSCTAYRLLGCAKTPPQFTAGQYPDDVAIDPATHTVYIANFGAGATGTVSVIDERTCNTINQAGCAGQKTLQVPGGNPDGILVNPANDTIYVTTIVPSGPNLISVFNGATCNATTTSGCSQTPAAQPVGYSDGGGPTDLSIALNQKTNTLYATNVNYDNQTADTVDVINAATCDATNTTDCNQTPATVTVGQDPRGLMVDPSSDTIYVVNHAQGDYAATISVINGATCNGQTTAGCNQTPATVATGYGAIQAAIDLHTHQIYTANPGDTSVSVINGSICNAANTSGCDQTPAQDAVGNYPTWIALDPDAGTAYVSNIDNVSVIPMSPQSHP
jgi:DNA-binding beta-propeller fold protein YncE